MADATTESKLTEEQAALIAQKTFRGHQGRKEAETTKLYAEYEAQLAEQELVKQQQMEEGLKLVKLDRTKTNKQNEMLVAKSANFVETFEKAESQRRMKMLLGTLLFSKRWVRRVRATLARKRQEQQEAKQREIEEHRRQKHQEEEDAARRREEKQRRRQEEMEQLEREFQEQQAALQQKAHKLAVAVEQHAQDVGNVQEELRQTFVTPDSADTGTTAFSDSSPKHSGLETKEAVSDSSSSLPAIGKKTSGEAQAQAEAEGTAAGSAGEPKAAGDSSADTGFLPSTGSPSGSPSRKKKHRNVPPPPSTKNPAKQQKKINWESSAAKLGAAGAVQAGADDHEASQEASLSAMTSQALLDLQATLQAKRHKVIKKMTTKLKTNNKKASEMSRLRTNLIQINGMIAKVKDELAKR